MLLLTCSQVREHLKPQLKDYFSFHFFEYAKSSDLICQMDMEFVQLFKNGTSNQNVQNKQRF